MRHCTDAPGNRAHPRVIMDMLTKLRAVCGLIAGVLIGVAVVVTVFAVTVASPSVTQMVLVIAAAIVLVLGIALQVVFVRQFGELPPALRAI